MFGRFRKRRGERPATAAEPERDTTVEELASSASELSSALGAAPVEDARLAAIERLAELRAAGSISAEAFAREKRRLENYG
jgi:hypothetical protein